jgi:hypothetical protein
MLGDIGLPELLLIERLQGQTTFKEIGNGVPTMPDRKRGQVPGLY